MDEREIAALAFEEIFGEPPPDNRDMGRAEVQSLSAFKAFMYSRYVHALHLQLLDEHLEQVTRYVETQGREGIGRLIVTMPPRHGKSLTVSRLFPAWHLGRNAHHRVMLTCYGQSLANKHSRAARNFINNPRYAQIFDTALAPDSQSVMEWDTNDTYGEGGMSALGVLGAATGKGAHILIGDDLLRGRKDAESSTIRDSVWDAWNDDLYTRLEPGGAIILMHTRWHEDDPVGRTLKREGADWVELKLPALAEEDDVMGRAIGEALWAERYDRPTLLKTEQKLGPYSFSAEYQQSPSPAEGGILKKKWFKIIPAVLDSDIVQVVRYWDLAMSEKKSADYTAGLKLAELANGEAVILDVARGKVELADLPKFLKATMLKDGKSVRQGFENKGYMTRAIQQVVKDAELRQYSIKGYDVEGDKLTRLLPAAARASLEMIHLLEGYWNDDFLDEATSFPNGAHDDQIDGLSGAWNMLGDKPKKRTGKKKRYA